MLYMLAHSFCEERGIILADTNLNLVLSGELILIDEIFTPDSSRFWAKDNYAFDIEIDSMDKEPVRTYLLAPVGIKTVNRTLPAVVVEETSHRYKES